VGTPLVYSRVPLQNYTASMYYRLALPLYWMKKLDLPINMDVDGMFGDRSDQERWMHMMSADIGLYYQQFGFHFHDLIRKSRTWKPEKDKHGVLRYPPTFIFDTDDDILSVLPMNDAYKALGYKDHHGNVLEDGAKIWVKDSEGNTKLLWSDGENINLAENRTNAQGWEKTLQIADLVTCTTPRCKEYVLRAGAKPENVYVFPNCIDLGEYPTVELAEHPNEVRILWQGSIAHREDLYPLRESFGRICKKYPHVKFVFWGADFKWLLDFISEGQGKLLPWVHHYEYVARLSMVNHDISLAPLHPYTFNQSRSAIKFYESAAVCRPAASLCQRTGEYQDVIIEGETGLLFDTPQEFEDKLSTLIENEMYRKTLAANAKDWVRENRDPAVHVPKLYERWMQAWEDRKQRPVEVDDADPVSEHQHDLRGSATEGSGSS